MHWDAQHLKNSVQQDTLVLKALLVLGLRALGGVAKLKCRVCGSIQPPGRGEPWQAVTVHVQAGAALSGLGTPQLLILLLLSCVTAMWFLIEERLLCYVCHQDLLVMIKNC